MAKENLKLRCQNLKLGTQTHGLDQASLTLLFTFKTIIKVGEKKKLLPYITERRGAQSSKYDNSFSSLFKFVLKCYL